jgi:peptidoglycan hydrolase-like protein with peptidoglycan-binding domain
MKILDIILEATNNVVVIGDSIAVGINGGEDTYCKGGINCTAVLAKVTAFIATGKAKGATVILSSGASNSTFERPTGEKQILNMAPVEQQLKLLKDAGASVALVGTGSAKSKTVTNQHGTYFVNFKDQQVNQKLENAARTYGATFLGPLENFDPNMNSGKGDGIHPYNGYAKLKQAGSEVALQSVQPVQSAQKVVPSEDKTGKTSSLAIPDGNVNPEVADIQKVLLALGYKLPRHGVDGVRGPETSSAIKQFQKDNGLTVDGDPGIETVTALNKLITSKGIKFTKSTDADVKKENATAFTGRKRKADAAPMPELQMDSVTKGKVGKVLDLVASKESAGYYDIMNGGKRFPEILDMTFAQLAQFQAKHANKLLKRSSAAGRYQIMGFNIQPKNSYVQKAGLDYDKDLFSPENQDKMGIVFLRECGLQSWLTGTISNEAFLDKIARVWMAFADSKGVSPHAGDGYNGQGIGPKWTLSALDRIQNSTA